MKERKIEKQRKKKDEKGREVSSIKEARRW